MRTGFGVDVHAFGGDPPLRLAGVVVDPTRGLVGTSDGDVAAHAVADALLGAAGLGDMGDHFPSTAEFAGADSMQLLAEVVAMVGATGFTTSYVDVTIVAQTVKVAPQRAALRANLAAILGIDIEAVSVKATTTDGLGFLGRDEGVAAFAVATLVAS